MTFDLAAMQPQRDVSRQPWRQSSSYWAQLNEATRHLPAPIVALDLAALSWNTHDLLRRAGGLPIRVASKSLRVRAVLEAVLAIPGYRGVLAYSLREALWLADTIDDIVVGYPSVDVAAICELAQSESAAQRITVMIDGVDQLDLIDAVTSLLERHPIRVCLDLDASWRSRALGHIGVRRSPVHSPEQLRRLAEEVLRRPGFSLVGIMAYEAQIAGVGDAPRGNSALDPVLGATMRRVQRASAAELSERRASAVAGVRELADLEFVNGGGTGSLENTAREASVTEVAAGSGLFGPHLFDHYRSFQPAPAVGFALDVVRKPVADIATVAGGGWIASGPHGSDRLPLPVWPEKLSYEPREAAGEVQTPLRGAAARQVRVGDRVWFRHTKSGEVMEHTNQVALVDGSAVREMLPSYRGEGKAFL